MTFSVVSFGGIRVIFSRGVEVNTWLGGEEKTGYQALSVPGGFSQYGGF